MSNKTRYFAELSYNGTNYHGWQTQPNAVAVQEVLDRALSTILRQKIETLGCGRTDTGVHARQFFAHFDVDSELPGGQQGLHIDNSLAFLNRVNSLLPNDIAIKGIVRVKDDAHARFDATLRSYEYHIHFCKDPFMQNFSWYVRDEPNIDLMNSAAAILPHYTDFSCFSKSNTQVFTNNCRIEKAEWVKTANGAVFHISADRFLRNMVRAIVGTLMMVGKEIITPEVLHDIIKSKDRSNAGSSVPACGLFLCKVKYPYL